MIKELFEKLGGALIVSQLLKINYTTAWRWESNNYIPFHMRREFVEICKKQGLHVTYVQLAECKKVGVALQ